jgi:hypothetical protein
VVRHITLHRRCWTPSLRYPNLYFTDKTNFSLDFSIAEPAIVPFAIEYGDVSTGDYRNIKTYYYKARP